MSIEHISKKDAALTMSELPLCAPHQGYAVRPEDRNHCISVVPHDGKLWVFDPVPMQVLVSCCCLSALTFSSQVHTPLRLTKENVRNLSYDDGATVDPTNVWMLTVNKKSENIAAAYNTARQKVHLFFTTSNS